MKKIVLILVAIMMIALPVTAYDFGGSVDASATITAAEETTLSPTAKVTGWAKVPFDGGSFATEAYYKLNVGEDSVSGVVDVSLLKVTFALPIGTLNVGRYSFSDITSSVFAMTSDGANIAASAGPVKIGAYVGYTGLLNAKTSSLDTDWESDENAVYAANSKYMLFLANVSAPNFLGGNTFALEGLGALNLNGEEKSGVSDGYSRFYGTLSAAGPITTTLYYSASMTGSFLTLTEDNTGILAKGSIVAYLPFKSMTVTGKGVFGSKNFQGITANPCAFGTLDAGVSATIKPISSMLCLLSADLYANTADGFEADKASWSVLTKWQAMSDVSAFLSIGQDIPLTDDTGSFTASFGGTVSF